jgi:hypothetical protein
MSSDVRTFAIGSWLSEPGEIIVAVATNLLMGNGRRRAICPSDPIIAPEVPLCVAP